MSRAPVLSSAGSLVICSFVFQYAAWSLKSMLAQFIWGFANLVQLEVSELIYMRALIERSIKCRLRELVQPQVCIHNCFSLQYLFYFDSKSHIILACPSKLHLYLLTLLIHLLSHFIYQALLALFQVIHSILCSVFISLLAISHCHCS